MNPICFAAGHLKDAFAVQGRRWGHLFLENLESILDLDRFWVVLVTDRWSLSVLMLLQSGQLPHRFCFRFIPFPRFLKGVGAFGLPFAFLGTVGRKVRRPPLTHTHTHTHTRTLNIKPQNSKPTLNPKP